MLFGVAYLVVRLLHLVLSALVTRDDPDSRGALLRFAPTAIVGASLLVVAGLLEGGRIPVWVVALAIDYLGPVVVGMGRGWGIAAEHFAERNGLIILIALGESIIAIGFGAGPHLGSGVLVAMGLGVVLVSALWWLYFDVAAIFARGRLTQVSGVERARLARDSYAYLHLPMVAGTATDRAARICECAMQRRYYVRTRNRRMVASRDRVLLTGSRSILGRPGG